MPTNSGGWLYEPTGTPVDKATADNAQARVLQIKQTADSASTDASQALSWATAAKASADDTAAGQAGAIANASAALTQSTQAVFTAESAEAIAQGADGKSDNAVDRVDALEVMGGVQPGSVNDAEMALHAQQQGGLFNTALNAQTVELISTEGTSGRMALDLAVAKTMTPPISRVESVVSLLLAQSAHQMILSQAQNDGWLGLYNPGDPAGRTMADGRIAALEDSLGNLPPLQQATPALRPVLNPQGFHALASAGGGTQPTPLRTVAFNPPNAQPNFIMTVASAARGGYQEFLIDGVAAQRNAILRTANGGMAIFAGSQSSSTSPVSEGTPLIVEGLYNGADTRLWVDDMTVPGGQPVGLQSMTGLTVGGRFDGETQFWRGTWGPVLVYDGVPSQAVRDRMSDLLETLASDPFPKINQGPQLETAAGLALLDESGYLVHGQKEDVRKVPASTMKMMTAYVARRTLTDPRLDDTRQMGGTTYTVRDLFHYSLMPSNNEAAETLADYAGELLLAGATGDPRARFMQEVHTVGESLGWAGNVYLTPSGLDFNMVTPWSFADLMRRVVAEDPFLHSVSNKLTYDMTTGERIWHTVGDINRGYLPGWTGGKSGTLLANQECLIGAWTTPSGKKFTGAVLASETGRRYTDMAWLIARSVIA